MPDSTSVSTYRAIHETLAWRVVPRDAVVVAGVGAPDWLQGQISQDLDQLRQVGGSAETLVLSPQGRIDSYCRVTMVADDPPGYLLDVKAGAGMNLYERLRRFKLRVKATVEVLERVHVLEQRGPLSRAIGDLLAGSPPSAGLMAAALGGLAEVQVSWPGFSGTDWLFTGDPEAIPALAAAVGLNGSSRELSSTEGGDSVLSRSASGGRIPDLDDAFEAARIEAGVPVLGRELKERTIPQEAGELVSRTVSFTKGCYTGQELVARIDARGSNTPRRLRGLVLAAGSPFDRVDFAGAQLRQGEQAVGEMTSSAWSPGFGTVVALAYLKRGVDVPARVTVEIGPAGGGGVVGGGGVPGEVVSGEVRELPLTNMTAGVPH